MRQLLRWTFTLAAALSALLCVARVGLVVWFAFSPPWRPYHPWPDEIPSACAFCVITAILPLWWLAAYRRSRQQGAYGLCRSCGYDLRATPDGRGTLLDRCPECGEWRIFPHPEL